MQSIKLFLALFIILLFAACEKVIEIDLNDASPQVVIVGELWEGQDTFEVNIHKTRSFFKNDEEELVEGAVVTLEEIGGSSYSLFDEGEGVYSTTGISTEPGKSYKLKVELEEEVYEAISEMRPRVELDSTNYIFFPGMFGQPGGYFVFMNYTDPANQLNFYKTYSFKNGEPQLTADDLWLSDDEFTNGNPVQIPLFTQFFELGDTIDIKFASIDAKVYDYFLTLSEIAGAGGGNSAAPANPNTNWSNDALGYFAAVNADHVQVIIE